MHSSASPALRSRTHRRDIRPGAAVAGGVAARRHRQSDVHLLVDVQARKSDAEDTPGVRLARPRTILSLRDGGEDRRRPRQGPRRSVPRLYVSGHVRPAPSRRRRAASPAGFPLCAETRLLFDGPDGQRRRTAATRRDQHRQGEGSVQLPSEQSAIRVQQPAERGHSARL